MTLSSADKDKLLALLRKMLETNQDPEVLVMRNALKREAVKRSTTIVELLELVLGSRIREVTVFKTPGWEEPTSLAHGLTIALRFVDRKVLNAFEEKFANDCAGHEHMTEKQQAVAQKIVDKVRKYAGA